MIPALALNKPRIDPKSTGDILPTNTKNTNLSPTYYLPLKKNL